MRLGSVSSLTSAGAKADKRDQGRIEVGGRAGIVLERPGRDAVHRVVELVDRAVGLDRVVQHERHDLRRDARGRGHIDREGRGDQEVVAAELVGVDAVISMPAQSRKETGIQAGESFSPKLGLSWLNSAPRSLLAKPTPRAALGTSVKKKKSAAVFLLGDDDDLLAVAQGPVGVRELAGHAGEQASVPRAPCADRPPAGAAGPAGSARTGRRSRRSCPLP